MCVRRRRTATVDGCGMTIRSVAQKTGGGIFPARCKVIAGAPALVVRRGLLPGQRGGWTRVPPRRSIRNEGVAFHPTPTPPQRRQADKLLRTRDPKGCASNSPQQSYTRGWVRNSRLVSKRLLKKRPLFKPYNIAQRACVFGRSSGAIIRILQISSFLYL